MRWLFYALTVMCVHQTHLGDDLSCMNPKLVPFILEGFHLLNEMVPVHSVTHGGKHCPAQGLPFRGSPLPVLQFLNPEPQMSDGVGSGELGILSCLEKKIHPE